MSERNSKLARMVSGVIVGAALIAGPLYLSSCAGKQPSKYVTCALRWGDSGPSPNTNYDKCVGEYKGN